MMCLLVGKRFYFPYRTRINTLSGRLVKATLNSFQTWVINLPRHSSRTVWVNSRPLELPNWNRMPSSSRIKKLKEKWPNFCSPQLYLVTFLDNQKFNIFLCYVYYALCAFLTCYRNLDLGEVLDYCTLDIQTPLRSKLRQVNLSLFNSRNIL